MDAPVAVRSVVGFQTHFAPGIGRLIEDNEIIQDRSTRFSIRLNWRRDDVYYRGWRATRSGFGGILHQHVIHSLALVELLIPTDDFAIGFECKTAHHRLWKQTEDAVDACIYFGSGRLVHISATVLGTGRPIHTLTIERLGYSPITISGQNLELGVYPRAAFGETGDATVSLRSEMLRAMQTTISGGAKDARLYSIRRLPRLLDWIEGTYDAEN
jgi:predicted dehydrogenase